MTYNLGQNICRLFHFLAQLVLTTSETELHYYHQKVNMTPTQKPNLDAFWQKNCQKSDKSERVNWKIVTTFRIKICMIRFLKDRMSSIPSDLHEEILKPNKSHTSRII